MTNKPALTADWLQAPALLSVFAALGADNARLVGGCVRDSLLGQRVSDIDLATTHQPDQTMALAQAAGLKAIPTGIQHGTITLVAQGETFEVTTLREDVETDGRHAKVAFTSDWQADAARRDFTMNALYADASGAVTDYFGGLADLASRTVRFIGAPSERIREDGLRILRFYRFSARFSDILDAEGRAACKHWAGALKSLSRERVRSEWLKLLASDNPAPCVAAMHEDGVLQTFLPEGDAAALTALADRERAVGVPAGAMRRFAAMVPVDAKQVEKIARRFKCSNVQREQLLALTQRIEASQDAAVVLYRHGAVGGVDLALLSDVPLEYAQSLAAAAQTYEKPDFPIRGQDLLEHTPLRGAEIGRAIFQLEERWIESGFALSRDELLALAIAP